MERKTGFRFPPTKLGNWTLNMVLQPISCCGADTEISDWGTKGFLGLSDGHPRDRYAKQAGWFGNADSARLGYHHLGVGYGREGALDQRPKVVGIVHRDGFITVYENGLRIWRGPTVSNAHTVFEYMNGWLQSDVESNGQIAEVKLYNQPFDASTMFYLHGLLDCKWKVYDAQADEWAGCSNAEGGGGGGWIVCDEGDKDELGSTLGLYTGIHSGGAPMLVALGGTEVGAGSFPLGHEHPSGQSIELAAMFSTSSALANAGQYDFNVMWLSATSGIDESEFPVAVNVAFTHSDGYEPLAPLSFTFTSGATDISTSIPLASRTSAHFLTTKARLPLTEIGRSSTLKLRLTLTGQSGKVTQITRPFRLHPGISVTEYEQTGPALTDRYDVINTAGITDNFTAVFNNESGTVPATASYNACPTCYPKATISVGVSWQTTGRFSHLFDHHAALVSIAGGSVLATLDYGAVTPINPCASGSVVMQETSDLFPYYTAYNNGPAVEEADGWVRQPTWQTVAISRLRYYGTTAFEKDSCQWHENRDAVLFGSYAVASGVAVPIDVWTRRVIPTWVETNEGWCKA